MDFDARIIELGLELPPAPKSMGTYLSAVQTGNLLFLSGHGPLLPNKTLTTGKIGVDLTEEEGVAAARQVGLTILATLKSHLGSLNRVRRVIKAMGMVNTIAEFDQHPKIINGFSDLMVEVFGENGKAARSAIGVPSLPANMAVEIEVIFELTENR